jgi:hypothetical protein
MVHALLSALSGRGSSPAGRRPRAWAAALGCALALLGCGGASRPVPGPAGGPASAPDNGPASACPKSAAAAGGPLAAGALPGFAQYAVSDYFQGMPAPMDLASHPDAARFADRLSPELDQGPNFAGHYRLVSWGCGTHCTASLIVDLRSGAVHDGVVAELGLLFRADSALLIVNPHPERSFEVGEVPAWAATRYYRWHHDRMELLGPHFRAGS